MKKKFGHSLPGIGLVVLGVLVSLSTSGALVACGGSKKSDTTPVHASPEAGGAHGGAAYAGHKPATASTPTPSVSANPCAGK